MRRDVVRIVVVLTLRRDLIIMKCSQNDCEESSVFRYTWPGKDEAGACPEHAEKLLGVAQAIGMHLQLIPLTIDEILADGS